MVLLMTHKSLLTAVSKPMRSDSCDSTASISSDSMAEMIPSSSLQSFPESDNDSLSFSSRSLTSNASPTSPRSIFKTYWTSPTAKKDSLGKEDEEDVLKRLKTLRLPSMNDDENDDGSAKVVHPQAPLVSHIKANASYDDSSIDYQVAPQIPTRSPRRQILPTPPPSTAVSSSLILPPHQLLERRKWCSTSALMKNKSPAQQAQSCLRKSRYSCSEIATSEAASQANSVAGLGSARLHHGLRNGGHADLHRENLPQEGRRRPRAQSDVSDLKRVSFYSQVSVFEFTVPPRAVQEGWSAYFT